jgi:hypothetical protein
MKNTTVLERPSATMLAESEGIKFLSLFPKKFHDTIRKAVKLEEIEAANGAKSAAAYYTKLSQGILDFESKHKKATHFNLPLPVNWGATDKYTHIENYPVDIRYYGGQLHTQGVYPAYRLNPLNSGIFLLFPLGIPVGEGTSTLVRLTLHWVEWLPDPDRQSVRSAVLSPNISVPEGIIRSYENGYINFEWEVTKKPDKMLICVNNKSDDEVCAYDGQLQISY